MKKKVLMLNSGGFDSAVLFHDLVLSKGHEVLSLFFDYGQNNVDKELAAVHAMCGKHDQPMKVLTLPEFDWSFGAVLGGKQTDDDSKEYVEMRNLIFLSYAVSIAEAKGCSEVYIALLATTEQGFKDAQPYFIRALNNVIKICNVEIKTPYFGTNKNGLANLAWYHDLKENDFFSCHYPVYGKPCGECIKCKHVSEVMEKANEITPLKALVSNGFDFTDESYKEAYRKSKLTELKLFINNTCEENCAHCFYGFEELAGSESSHDERMSVVEQAVKMGVKTIHICGREPFATPDRLFNLAADIKASSPDTCVSVVTNGKTLYSLTEQVKKSKLDRICLSVDSLNGNLNGENVRNTKRLAVFRSLDALASIAKASKEACVFIAAHAGNRESVMDTINSALDLGIKSFFVSMVRPLGKGANIECLQDYEVGELFKQLKTIDRGHIDLFVNREYVLPFLKSGGFPCHPHEEYLTCYRAGSDAVHVTDNLTLNAEFVCSSFNPTVTVTADGYVVGCTAGLGNDYHKRSAGNVRDNTLESLVRRGRVSVLSKNNGQCHYQTC